MCAGGDDATGCVDAGGVGVGGADAGGDGDDGVDAGGVDAGGVGMVQEAVKPVPSVAEASM